MRFNNKLIIAACLIPLLALSLALRIWGMNWGIPNEKHFSPIYGEDYNTMNIVQRIHPPDFHLHYTINPSLSYYQIGAWLWTANKLGLIRLVRDRAWYVSHVSEYAKLYQAGIWNTIFWGVCLTVVMFAIGYTLSGLACGTLCALFYAITPIAIIQAHTCELTVFLGFLIAMSYLCFIKHWVYAGAIFAGLAISTKYTAVPLIGLIALQRNWKLGLIATGAFLAGSPCLFSSWKELVQGLNVVQGHIVGKSDWLWPFWCYRYAVGLPILALSLIGLGICSKTQGGIMALLFLIPYLFLLCLSHRHMTRYIHETLPFLLPFAAYMVSRKWMLVFVPILCFWSVSTSCAYDYSFANEESPQDQASNYIGWNMKPGDTIGTYDYPDSTYPSTIYQDYWGPTRYGRPQQYDYTQPTPQWYIDSNYPPHPVFNSPDYRQVGDFHRNVLLPDHAGIDWPYYLTEIRIYEKRQ